MQQTIQSNTLEPQVSEYYSSSLRRFQPYTYTMPLNPSGDRLPLILMLHGYGTDHRGWLAHTRVTSQLAGFGVVAVFPQGDNGWYTNSFDGEHLFEDDIMLDLVPHLLERLPVTDPGPSWAIGGMSMGGYGSIKLALKYTDTFGVGFSHAGAFERMLKPDLHPVFGDPVQHAGWRRQQSPAWLAEQVLCRFPIVRPRLYIDCGESDPLLDENRRLSQHLNFIGLHHTYREQPGHHTWPYWNRAFRLVLPDIAGSIGARPVHQQ